MTTKLESKPVAAITLDVVGYLGDGRFVILNPVKAFRRELPTVPESSLLAHLPFCIAAVITTDTVINFEGDVCTLRNLGGIWYYSSKVRGVLEELKPNTFFEVGEMK